MTSLLTDFFQPQKLALSDFPQLTAVSPGCKVPEDGTFHKGTRVLRVSGTDVFIGVPREPLEFLSKAIKLVHPVERSAVVSLAVQRAIRKHMSNTAADMLKARHAFFSQVTGHLRALSADEAQLHSKMPVHLKNVLAGKRVLLFEKLLRDIEHPDTTLVSYLKEGFPLYGWLDKTGVFASKLQPPTLHPHELLQMAPQTNRMLLQACRIRDKELDEELWSATLADVEKGWAAGPFSLKEAVAQHGRALVLSRRFAVKQKAKVRAIDDFSASHINLCTGAREKVSVEAVDAAAVMIRQWMSALQGTGVRLVGKTFDLKAAYRQLGVATEHLHASWICVASPETGEPALFRLHALPFGASASVSNFLRCAEALKSIGAQQFFFSWTSFFDDFIIVCPESFAADTVQAVKLFFKLLGWQLALEPEKCKPFSTKFQALGVFNMDQADEGILEISSTESRKAELTARIDDILQQKSLSARDAASLRSRLLFATEAQIFGRYAKKALKGLLGAVADQGRPTVDV